MLKFGGQKSAKEVHRALVAQRRECLSEARRQAFRHIQDQFPDAITLITNNAERFVSFSQASRKIVSGYFRDLPEIPHPTDESSEDEFEAASEKYIRETQLLREYVKNKDNASSLRFRQFWGMPFDEVNRGFGYTEYDSRRAGACRLEIDDICLWQTTLSDPRSLHEFRHAIEKTWYQSDEISARRSFTIKVEFDLFGYGSMDSASFRSLFLGGRALSGRAKVQFSQSVIEPICRLISAVPIWQNGEEGFFDFLENIEINDEIMM